MEEPGWMGRSTKEGEALASLLISVTLAVSQGLGNSGPRSYDDDVLYNANNVN
jgi:hypothetical protein